MARPSKGDRPMTAAERQAARRAARGDVTKPQNVTKPPVTKPEDVTKPPDVTKPDVTKPEAPLWRSATGFVGCRDVPGVPHDADAEPWAGVGRGVPTEWRGDRYVLVARGHGTHDIGEHAVVSEADWLLRHDQRCQHGLRGWSCHVC